MPASSPTWLGRLPGRFLVFDGPDGSGKSTQIRRFQQLLAGANVPLCHVREPGGTEIGEQIRQILLNPANDGMDVHCEMLLYMASRAQLITERVRPALKARQCVLADRFISSTLAYQGAAGGMDTEAIMQVARIALGDCWPDLVVIFDVDEQTAASRLSPLMDRMEQKGAAYHRRVREGFLEQARQRPERHLVVDATSDADTVFSRLQAGLSQWLENQPEA